MWELRMNVSFMTVTFPPMTAEELGNAMKVLRNAKGKDGDTISFHAEYIDPITLEDTF